MTAIYIYGAGGHGAVVAELAEEAGCQIAGFIDDTPGAAGRIVLGHKVLGGCDCIPDGASVVLAIGDNKVRAQLRELADRKGWNLPVLVHPSAAVSRSAQLGAGTVVMAQSAVNARAVTGKCCILNTSCSVDHDCVIGDCAHIAPGVVLSGSVRIGARTLLGVGSCGKPGVTIGSDCVIGAGSVVVSDIPDGAVAFGCPARIKKD